MILCADLFCGGGGTSTGMINAFKRAGVDFQLIGVNHWNIAIETNRINHPFEKLYCSTIQNVKPREAVPSGRLHFLWASPECTNHSRAKGGRPRDEQSRSTAWDILKWAQELYIDRIYIENVVEFLEWGPIDAKGRPMESKKGETFRAFVAALESLGYHVDWQTMNAADFGAPTSRVRLIIQAVRGRGKIVWPDPTHAKEPGMFGEKPWRAAREIIDWTIPGKSIFARKKPLAENTIRRIESGIRKYWGEWAEPFLIVLRGTKDRQQAVNPSVKEPLRTLTSQNKFSMIEPFILSQKFSNAPVDCRKPLPTVTTVNSFSVVEPFLVRYNGGDERHHSINDPVPVLDCSNRYGIVYSPFILNLEHTSESVMRSVDQTLRTVTCQNKFSLVEPFLIKYYGNEHGAESISEPIDTICTKDRFGLVRGYLVEVNGARYVLDIRFRMLQPHELAKGMGFPADYKFAGNKKDQVKQIGNAVSPNLSEALVYSALCA